ncbi:unnamed protein product [Ectocarpus fasciculatus]
MHEWHRGMYTQALARRLTAPRSASLFAEPARHPLSTTSRCFRAQGAPRTASCPNRQRRSRSYLHLCCHVKSRDPDWTRHGAVPLITNIYRVGV